MLSNIAVCHGTQKRIADRMSQHIGIGMPKQSSFMGDADPAKNQSAPLNEPMGIVAYSSPYHGGTIPDFNRPNNRQAKSRHAFETNA